MPIVIIEVWLAITPVYGLAGLYGTTMGSDTYWYFLLLVVTGTCVARAWCMLVSAAAPNETVATVTAAGTKILFVTAAGFLITGMCRVLCFESFMS